VKATQVPNINSKAKYQKLQSHLYNGGIGDAQNRDSPVLKKGSGLQKLQNLKHGTHGNMLAKMESNMRTTHLKLDPIDTSMSSPLVNPNGSSGVLTVTNGD